MSEKRGPGRPVIGKSRRIPMAPEQWEYIQAEAERTDRPYARVIRELLTAGIAAKQKENSNA
ncbi:hypothetical protein ML5_0867 [Micromonospora sp. L5]|uniref:hypothetical protein n=1 Tax=Micromonospora sp. (strain L5) TaxID=648999 RepID=UPI0001C45C93|nr:hypothetical protein [Micromonospora sp. L5]ADU06409.1 hypothetical protein ML5_0867 [Micromonospora sp. L5]